jgi:hypothetical protein
MRRMLLLILVLLLPLRLWAADAMGLAAAIDAAGGHAPCHQAAVAVDGAGQAAAVAGAVPALDADLLAGAGDAHAAAHADSHADSHAAATPGGACPLCGLCQMALGAPAAHATLPQPLPAGPPVAVTATACEAEPQRAVEPPRG